jgi:hypothetical protein
VRAAGGTGHEAGDEVNEWRPLNRRGKPPDEFDGPFEGVPPWLKGALWTWVRDQLTSQSGAIARFRAIAISLRLDIEDARSPNPGTPGGLEARLRDQMFADDDLFLNVVDLVARDVFPIEAGRGSSLLRRSADLSALDRMLRDGASVWHVVDEPKPHLQRRLPPEVEELAHTATGRAAEYLSEAWRQAYGRDPDPSASYAESIKAVEVAAIPVVSPNNPRATLGTIIRDMRAKPEKWSFRLGEDPAGVDTVIANLDLLWTGHDTRHGSLDPDAPIRATQEQAETAAQLAALLVSWFGDQHIVAISDD